MSLNDHGTEHTLAASLLSVPQLTIQVIIAAQQHIAWYTGEKEALYTQINAPTIKHSTGDRQCRVPGGFRVTRHFETPPTLVNEPRYAKNETLNSNVARDNVTLHHTRRVKMSCYIIRER